MDLISESYSGSSQPFSVIDYLHKKYYPLRTNTTYNLEFYIKPFASLQSTDSIGVNTCVETSRRICFDLTEDMYNKINIDQYKCHSFKELKPTEEEIAQNPEGRHRYLKKIVIKLQKG